MFRFSTEARRRFAERMEARKQSDILEGWGQTPAYYKAEWSPNLLDRKGRWDVIMNGCAHICTKPTAREAELEAARLNYERGAYYRPTQYGLDGI